MVHDTQHPYGESDMTNTRTDNIPGNNKIIRKALLFLTVFMLAFAFFPGEASAKAVPFSDKKPLGITAAASSGSIAVTWEKLSGASYYLVYEAKSSINKEPAKGTFRKVAAVRQSKKIRSGLTKGKDYTYYVIAVKKKNGHLIKSRRSIKKTTTLPKKGRSTIKNLLRTGTSAIGVLYVWGGGWNKADTAAGLTARRTGRWPKWRSFGLSKSSGYNYLKHRYEIYSGLDCSGFCGWSIYNVMHVKNGKKGYVTKSSKFARSLQKKGFGSYLSAKKVKSHKAGDIMARNGHVWISVGSCEDGSVVILHASPPAVTLAGTPSSSGRKNSQAVRLARKYMSRYHSYTYEKFKDKGLLYRDRSFLKDYSRFRWYKATLSDPEGYRSKTAAQVLRDLYE